MVITEHGRVLGSGSAREEAFWLVGNSGYKPGEGALESGRQPGGWAVGLGLAARRVRRFDVGSLGVVWFGWQPPQVGLFGLFMRRRVRLVVIRWTKGAFGLTATHKGAFGCPGRVREFSCGDSWETAEKRAYWLRLIELINNYYYCPGASWRGHGRSLVSIAVYYEVTPHLVFRCVVMLEEGGSGRAPLVREFILEFLSTCRMRDTEIGLDVADTLCLHSEEEMTEPGFGAYWAGSKRVIPDKGGLRDYWIEISFDGDFLGPAPSYAHIRDSVRRLCHNMIACSISGREQDAEKVTRVDLFYLRTIDHGTANVSYLLAQYFFHYAEGRKSRTWLSGGHFIGRLAAHFDLVGDQGLRCLSMVVSELPVIDLHELVRLNIYARFSNTQAWVASRPERQQAAAAGSPRAVEDAPAADEGAQAVPAPVQAP
ncbi:hypothetical protein Tco_0422334 [Tanacetum coccineum]